MLTLMETIDAASEKLPVKEQQIYNTLHSIRQYMLWMYDSDEPGVEEASSIIHEAMKEFKEENPRWYELDYTHASDYARKWHVAYTVLQEERSRIGKSIRGALNKIL